MNKVLEDSSNFNSRESACKLKKLGKIMRDLY